MAKDEINRDMLEQALDEINQARVLLERALAWREDSPPRTHQLEESPKEVTLTGKVGRPEFSEKKSIALWEAGLQLTEENGDKRWIDIQTWRKSAVFARDNVERAQIVTVVGKWKHEEWSDQNGHDRERDIFVVTYFK